MSGAVPFMSLSRLQLPPEQMNSFSAGRSRGSCCVPQSRHWLLLVSRAGHPLSAQENKEQGSSCITLLCCHCCTLQPSPATIITLTAPCSRHWGHPVPAPPWCHPALTLGGRDPAKEPASRSYPVVQINKLEQVIQINKYLLLGPGQEGQPMETIR